MTRYHYLYTAFLLILLCGPTVAFAQSETGMPGEKESLYRANLRNIPPQMQPVDDNVSYKTYLEGRPDPRRDPEDNLDWISYDDGRPGQWTAQMRNYYSRVTCLISFSMMTIPRLREDRLLKGD